MTAISPSTFSTFVAAAALSFCLGGVGAAGAGGMPDSENGRYTLSAVTDGVIRLDTRTGEVSTCTNTGPGWACYTVPDERAALDTEIGRLQADNEKLRAELAARQPTVTGKIDERERKIEIPLPSDRDMDRVMSFLEQAWRRLIDMANRVQKDVAGRI
jgi:hypothetical protein